MKNSLKLNEIVLLTGAVSALLLSLSIGTVNGQATTLGNTVNTPGFDFLGWDNTVNSDVLIRHKTAGQPIIFGTARQENQYLTT